VSSWLTGAGLHVTKVESHNRYIEVSGDVAHAESAFGVTIDKYLHNGLSVQAPSGTLSAPASVASSVLTVMGVDTTPSLVSPSTQKPPPPEPGFRNAGPCSRYYGEKLATTVPQFNGHTLPYAPCGYTGTQFRSAYEGSTALDGTGVTVAITDAYGSPNIASDAATYAARNGDRAYSPGQFTQTVASPLTRVNFGRRQCAANGWYGEESLDVEAVHAMAQGARIRYYGAASCYDADFLDTFAKVNDEDVAQIVTNSWGSTELGTRATTIAAYEQAFLQGAAEGITYMFSSGDNGDESLFTGAVQPDYPVSDPYATGVGGTTTAIDSSGHIAWETGWGTLKYSLSSDGTWNPLGFLYGAGGGESLLFGQPSYQAGITPAGARGVPDVAMDADVTTGMLIGETQTFPEGAHYDQYRIGGTSLASPLFAGMTALAFQHAGGGVGLLNPTIYANASNGVFTDVTGPGPDAGNVRVDYANGLDASAGLLYSVRTFDQDTSLDVNPGWDDVTGLGSPNSGWLTAVG
jgi:subtilase family serine protease